MKTLRRLFDQNRAWANAISSKDPQFFRKLSRLHAPEYLWIGCADSRVPANEIVGLLPGELFVHRNTSNVVTRMIRIEMQHAAPLMGQHHEYKQHSQLQAWAR